MRTVHFNVRLAEEDMERLKALAEDLDIPAGTLVRYTIKRFLTGHRARIDEVLDEDAQILPRRVDSMTEEEV